MKTVREACVLQDNALSIRVSDQIEQLDELIADEGDGEAFFDRTFFTNGLRQLIDESLARLAGESSQAVFHLKQAMGGGKTHLLVALGLLAKHPQLRAKYYPESIAGAKFGAAQVAAFNGRNSPPGFFWGEIADQLGKGEQFARYWQAGPEAPDESAWIKVFEGESPVLILLDELPPYFYDLNTKPVGNGTVADIATRAFANLLTAANKKKNVCVVVSDLSAAYDVGTSLIVRALGNARAEIGRQERTITPVDLSANEIYDILRKRLFKSLPDQREVKEIARVFGERLDEAIKAKTAGRGASAVAHDISDTYPFHPRLKNIVALFKENEQFKQTRGLIELVSRLLQSVWESPVDDVYLIGPQHFDFSIADVRDKLIEISRMPDVIATDLWDANQSAHAQITDLQTGKKTASQVGTLVFTASLSTAVNAVKGLTKEEMVECLVSPDHEPSEYLTAFDELYGEAWYLHHTPEFRYYFDAQENITKLLQSLAHDAPENQVEELIRRRMHEMFEPKRKSVYTQAFPLPKLSDVADPVRHTRVLLIISPDSKIPPEEVAKFFDSIPQKNNLCVLTGDNTAMASLEKAARQHYAAQKADARIPLGHPQREDLELKQQDYSQDFNSTILNLFDKVLFPRQAPGQPPKLVDKPLDLSRDMSKAFDGEEQIEKTLTADPLKLYLDVEQNFGAIRDKAEDLLWPAGMAEARWTDVADRYAEQPGMPWLPPRGLDQLKGIACNRGLWEDLGNGYVTKSPPKKQTSVQVVPESPPDDAGTVRLRVMAQNAGPAPRIHVSQDSPVTEASPVLKDQTLESNALRVHFLAVDPSGQFETGQPNTWINRLVIRNLLTETSDQRLVELRVAPTGTLRYTLDGSEPRNGIPYNGPIPIGSGDTLMQVFAEADALDAKQEFFFAGKGERELKLKETERAALVSAWGRVLDSRSKAFRALSLGAERQIAFQGVTLTVGQGDKMAQITIGDIPVDAGYLQSLLSLIAEKLPPDAPATMTFKRAIFPVGSDMKEFAAELGLELRQADIEQ